MRNSIMLVTSILLIVSGVYGAGGAILGLGTAENPFLIEDLADFDEFAGNSSYWSSGVHTKLTSDIDLTGRTYTTAVIAKDTNITTYEFDGIAFAGEFDGDSHEIVNLTIDTEGLDKSQLGLFGQNSASALVANIKLKNVSLTGSGNWEYGDFTGDIGAIVGNNSGAIKSCLVIGTVTVGVSSEDVGGLCGLNQSTGIITGCVVVGSVNGGSNSGGLGGLCGSNDGSITKSWASCSVTGRNSLGGVCGYLDGGNIINCYSTGEIIGTAGDLGGLCGERDGGTISDCFWDIETSNMTTSSGGTGKTTGEMQTQSTFTDAGWDFINTWNIGENQTYPYLRTVPASDINKDEIVNLLDLSILALQWMSGAE